MLNQIKADFRNSHADAGDWSLINQDNGLVLARRVRLARNFAARLKGLMFTAELPPGEALLIEPCRSIHTFFMNYAIDVLYLDACRVIAAAEPCMPPGKLGRYYPSAASVIELPAGTLEQTHTRVGQAVLIGETQSHHGQSEATNQPIDQRSE